MGEVHVDVLDVAGVDLLAQRGPGLVGRAPHDGAGRGEFLVDGLAARGAREDAQLERGALERSRASACGERARDGLGGARRGEPAEGDGVPVVDVADGLLGREDRE